jgi:hypothetical protein
MSEAPKKTNEYIESAEVDPVREQVRDLMERAGRAFRDVVGEELITAEANVCEYILDIPEGTEERRYAEEYFKLKRFQTYDPQISASDLSLGLFRSEVSPYWNGLASTHTGISDYINEEYVSCNCYLLDQNNIEAGMVFEEVQNLVRSLPLVVKLKALAAGSKDLPSEKPASEQVKANWVNLALLEQAQRNGMSPSDLQQDLQTGGVSRQWYRRYNSEAEDLAETKRDVKKPTKTDLDKLKEIYEIALEQFYDPNNNGKVKYSVYEKNGHLEWRHIFKGVDVTRSYSSPVEMIKHYSLLESTKMAELLESILVYEFCKRIDSLIGKDLNKEIDKVIDYVSYHIVDGEFSDMYDPPDPYHPMRLTWLKSRMDLPDRVPSHLFDEYSEYDSIPQIVGPEKQLQLKSMIIGKAEGLTPKDHGKLLIDAKQTDVQEQQADNTMFDVAIKSDGKPKVIPGYKLIAFHEGVSLLVRTELDPYRAGEDALLSQSMLSDISYKLTGLGLPYLAQAVQMNRPKNLRVLEEVLRDNSFYSFNPDHVVSDKVARQETKPGLQCTGAAEVLAECVRAGFPHANVSIVSGNIASKDISALGHVQVRVLYEGKEIVLDSTPAITAESYAGADETSSNIRSLHNEEFLHNTSDLIGRVAIPQPEQITPLTTDEIALALEKIGQLKEVKELFPAPAKSLKPEKIKLNYEQTREQAKAEILCVSKLILGGINQEDTFKKLSSLPPDDPFRLAVLALRPNATKAESVEELERAASLINLIRKPENARLNRRFGFDLYKPEHLNLLGSQIRAGLEGLRKAEETQVQTE